MSVLPWRTRLRWICSRSQCQPAGLRWAKLLLSLFVVVGSAGLGLDNNPGLVFAQGASAEAPPPEDESDESEIMAADDEAETIELPTRRPMVPSRVVEDGPGVIGNVSFLGMKTFGREESIAPVEVMPYLLLDEDFLFSDLRGFVSTEGKFGGNIGLGYRKLVPNQNAWYGLNAWYDIDDTSGQLFHQLGIGFEAVFKRFEARGNAYFPVGDTDQTLESSARNARFLGNQLLFDQRILQGYALRGVDAEVGIVLPTPKVGETSQLRWYVGGYFFSGSGNADSINGIQTRGEWQLASAVTTHLQFTNDQEYGSNIMVGVQLDLPMGERHPTSSWKRNTPSPFRFIHRNYNIILDRVDESQSGLVAFNPLTSQEYNFVHVDTSAAAGGDGSVTNPYHSLAEAMGDNPDVVFVHAGSTITESIVLTEGQKLIGDSGTQWIDLAGGTSAQLPTLNTANAAGPVFSNVTGNAITLASGSTVSGFNLDDIQGNGIVGTNVEDVTVRNVSFSNISGDALKLNNSTGQIRLRDLTFTDITGSGIVVDGGSANVSIIEAQFTHIGDDALHFEDLTTDGSVTLANLTVDDVGENGLELMNVDADVDVSGLEVNESQDVAIMIRGGDGTYAFHNQTLLKDVAGGLDMRNSDAVLQADLFNITTNTNAAGIYLASTTGDSEISSVVIDATSGPGIVLRDVEALAINAGYVSTKGHGALDVEDSNVDLSLTRIDVDDGAFGIRMVDVTGGLTVFNSGGNSGTIKNTDTAIILNNAGSSVFRFVELKDNGVGIQSTGNDVVAIQSSNITGSAGYAIDSTNDERLSVQGVAFANNGAVDGGTVRVRASQTGTYRSEFISSTFNDTKGTPLAFETTSTGVNAVLDTTISGSTFTASRGGHSGIRVQWQGLAGTTIANNTFNLSGASMKGIDLRGLAATEKLNATLASNVMTLSGSNSIGVDIQALGESNLQIQTSDIEFDAAGGTGLRFDLQETATVWIAGNTITDTVSAGTGINFLKITDLSRVQFDSNKIDLQSTGAAVDRGIIFSSIDGSVQLYGTTNNIVQGATDAYYIPTGKSTGRFYVNGVLVP